MQCNHHDGYLAKSLSSRHPSLDIELAVSRGAEVLGGNVEHPVREAQLLHQLLLGREQLVVNGVALLGQTDDGQLDLGELVESVESSRCSTSASGLSSEASARQMLQG